MVQKINNYEDTQWLFEPNKWYSFSRNKDIRKQLEEVKKFIGYLPETVPLYKEMTVREFLKL